MIIRVCVLSVLVVSTISCRNEYPGYENPSSPTPVVLPKGTMSATVNGVAWNADGDVQARNSPSNYLSVYATDQHAWTVGFFLNNFIVGSQSIAAKLGGCSMSNTTGNFAGQNGTVTITSMTATGVAGTFDCGTLDRSDNGSGAKTATVVSGTFDIKF